MTNDATAQDAVKPDFMDSILGKETEQPEIEDSSPEGTDTDDKASKSQPEADKEPEKKVLVPHGAFHEEREKRKELQKRLAEQEEKNKTIEERQNKLFELLAKKDQPQEELYIDPIAKIQSTVNEVVEKINKKDEAESLEAKGIRESNELIQKYSASANAFSKDAPDFPQAYNYILEKQKSAFSKIYRDPNVVMQKLAQYEQDLVKQAYANEENPAEVLYKVAEDYGYKPASAEKPNNGQSRKTVEDIDKGLKASKSLGSGGAKSADSDDLSSLTAVDLAEMTQDEFDALFTKLEKQSNRKH